jgi:hypothetical protein
LRYRDILGFLNKEIHCENEENIDERVELDWALIHQKEIKKELVSVEEIDKLNQIVSELFVENLISMDKD